MSTKFCYRYAIVALIICCQVSNLGVSAIANQSLSSMFWPVDDKPYVMLRKQIENNIKHGQKAEALASKYCSDYTASGSPVALFGWGYASRLAAKDSQPSRPFDETKILAPVEYIDALSESGKLPRSYNFVRLHFLLGSEVTITTSSVKIGETLLSYNPQDYDVKYQLVKLLWGSDSLADFHKAVAYSKELVARNAKDAAAHSDLAGTYYTLWLHTSQRIYAEKAAQEYNIYLKLTPQNDYFRKDVQYMLNDIQAHHDPF